LDELALRFKDLLRGAAFVDWQFMATVAFQLVIIIYAIFWMWGRIKGTQAERLVKGVVVLVSVCLLSWMLRLTLITTLLQQLIPIAVVSLFIIFQPEIRRGLGHLGRTPFRVDLSLEDSQKERSVEVMNHILSAVRELSKERTGALIVIEPPEGERDYVSPGTTINGDVSSHLLVSIFQPKSPLHDGAVVIRSDNLLAAGVILPITDNPKLSYRYGTRHRAAIGLSEIYDGLCIVVSEETGAISAANRGMLMRYNTAEELREPLAYFYEDGTAENKDGSLLQSFLALFARGTTRGAETVGATPIAPMPTLTPLSGLPEMQVREDSPPMLEECPHPEPF
jgi:diadenylate cyclase